MKVPWRVAITAAAGTAALVTPICISIHLAWKESMAAEEAQVRLTASDLMHRVAESVEQSWAIYYKLRDDHLSPCSPAEIDLMRSLDVASTYVQAVGRIKSDALICTSLGTTEPIPVGPAEIIGEKGVEARTGVRLPIAGNHALNIFSKDGIAVLHDPTLIVDMPVEGNDISLSAVILTGSHQSSFSSNGGATRPQWLKPLPKGGEITFVDSGHIVCAMRSRVSEMEVVVAAPLSYAARRERQFALILAPVGLGCGALLAWANVYVSRKRHSLGAVLRGAVRRREFHVEYQPIVELATRRWVGAEALVRWRRGKRMIRPDVFIPMAEETGLITGITECVFEEVARDLPAILAADPEFSVSINLSAADLSSRETLLRLDRALNESGAKPGNIEVEATERGFLQGDEAHAVVAAIRERGVTVAIDDFGTGYSSLSRVQELPLDVLKIDKSFVDAVDTDGVTSHVILHIIEMAQSLKLDMVAEGVETENQAQFLLKHGVEYAQGWLFARAMPAANLCEMLAARAKPEVAVSA